MSWGGFDPQPTLEGRTVRLRPLSSEDREPLFAAASDPLIWEQHPAHNRHERAVFDRYFDFLVSRAAALCISVKSSGQVIGTSSFYLTPEDPPAASIGFTFITRDHWGGQTNGDVKALMLDHLFEDFDSVSLHIDPNNIRSQRGTAKLGAVRVADRTLDLGTGPEALATFELSRDLWRARRGA